MTKRLPPLLHYKLLVQITPRIMKILQIRTVLATVLLSLCIGQVYAWSLLSNAVNSVLNHDMSFAFSLAILFLGLSAAFMGKFVERNPKATYIMSVIFFWIHPKWICLQRRKRMAVLCSIRCPVRLLVRPRVCSTNQNSDAILPS